MHFLRALCLLFLVPFTSYGKKAENNKTESNPLVNIQNDIAALCSDKMAGRQVGSEGEQLAANYIEERFKSMGIAPYQNKYQWEFSFKSGIRIGGNAAFKVFEYKLQPGTDVIFMPYGKGNSFKGSALPRVYEPENVWLVPLSQVIGKASNQEQKLIYEYARKSISQNATAVVFLNDLDITQDLSLQNLDAFDPLSIPVAFVNTKPYQDFFKPNLKKDWIDVEARLGFENANTTGRNVIAAIDNKADINIVLAAHYDHLGDMGGVYKGADYNASGVAALLCVAEMVKNLKLRHYNFIFLATSGKEAGMQGSKSFVQQNEFILNKISCFINLNMLGRLNLLKDLYIGGTGTAPNWNLLLQKSNKGFVLHTDSSGIGYTDINTFYAKNIPVLNISSGYTDDYKRLSDDPSRINNGGILEISSFVARLLGELDRQPKMIFNKTYDLLPELDKLKTDLGILHDISFNLNGIRVAGTLPGSKAAVSGMLSGDVITRIGMFPIIDYVDFMEAISRSESGKETTILVKRGATEFKFFVVL